VVEKVCSLWDIQKGLCAFSGRQMVWKKEDIQTTPGFSACIGPFHRGVRWTADTAVLLCADARALVSIIGMTDAVELARIISRFAKFRKEETFKRKRRESMVGIKPQPSGSIVSDVPETSHHGRVNCKRSKNRLRRTCVL
jgi:hypothetical protein